MFAGALLSCRGATSGFPAYTEREDRGPRQEKFFKKNAKAMFIFPLRAVIL